MKLKRRKIKRGRVEIIPMIDTIVILLIFYMTFSRFAEASKEANLKLPKSKAGVDNKEGGPVQVVLNMYSKDKVILNKEQIPIEDLPARLMNIKKDPKYAKMLVVLRGDRNMTYADLSAFMKACAKARLADVTFTTEEVK
ncbi:MAG: biopolymer transporter ExbD [Verrucomicrobiota bacterium]